MNNNNIKDIILNYYDYFVNLKQTDDNLIHNSVMIDIIQDQLINNILSGQDERIIELNNMKQLCEKNTRNILQIKLSMLYKTYPDIFEKILAGIHRDELEQMLDK